MALDINKCIKAATIPTLVLVVLGIIQVVAGMIPLLGVITGLLVFVASLVVLAWAGFMAVKKQGMDLVGAVVTSTIAGAVSGLIGGLIGIALFFLGIGAAAAAIASIGSSGLAVYGAAMIIGMVLGIAISVVFSALLGAICGAVGAYVAQMKN